MPETFDEGSDQVPRPATALTDLQRTAHAYATDRALWADRVEYDPVSRYYHRLAGDDASQVWLLTWLPGQGTEWHDHGDSRGAFVVVQGTLTEDVAGEELSIGPTLVHASSNSRAFPESHVHKVTNSHLEPAVSIHVYSPRLTVMNIYRHLGDRLVPDQRQLAGANW